MLVLEQFESPMNQSLCQRSLDVASTASLQILGVRCCLLGKIAIFNTHMRRSQNDYDSPTERPPRELSEIIIITSPQPLITSTDTAPPAVTANSINTSVHPFESRTRTALTPRETIEMTSTKASAVHSTQVRQHTLHSPPLSLTSVVF